jgi:DNA modification methylase
MKHDVIHGDSLEILRTLPDESVHCCVTSPPYWGLRDYGTATWEGGDPDCDHQYDRTLNGRASTLVGTTTTQTKSSVYRNCPKCGARRIDAQLGLERTPDEYVANLVAVFREVRRVLRKDGTLWLNLGDSYTSGNRKERDPGQSKIHPAYEGKSFSDGLRPGNPPGLKPKDLVGIPWRVAFALQADGWWLRQDIIWAKPNPMPESVTDRCTKAHEYIFLLTKSARYFYNARKIAEEAQWEGKTPAGWDTELGTHGTIHRTGRSKGKNNNARGMYRNKRSVWTIPTQPFPEAHYATFPEELPRLCILAGCPPDGIILDPFCGSGTTGLVAKKLGHPFIGIELNPTNVEMSYRRINSIPDSLFSRKYHE